MFFIRLDRDEQLIEAQRMVEEMEIRLKDQLFGNLRLREDLAKLQSEYDMLSGEFEAIRSKASNYWILLCFIYLSLFNFFF